MAMSQPISSTIAFAATSPAAGIPCCNSSLSAPLCRSPPTSRMATNGNRKTAASSQALNVGAHTPIKGAIASPTPPAVPPSPLTSAYVRTALMNEMPTSGPRASNNTHQDRDATNSRRSLSSSHKNARLCERKKHLFQIRERARGVARRGVRGQLLHRALAANPAVAQEHETVAHSRRVGDLMDREEQRPAARGMTSQRRRHVARLAKIQ